MATFLHRINKILRDDDGTGLARENEIRNPDMSAVAGLAAWQWVIDGDAVRPANASELASAETAMMPTWREQRIVAINARTAAIIESGAVQVNGVSVSTALTNQVSLSTLKQLADMGLASYPQQVSATNGGIYTITSGTDFRRVAGLVAKFVMDAKSAGRALRQQVIAATTKSQLDAVLDNRT